MHRSPEASSADDFIVRNPLLLDSKIMLTHYSADLLFSDQARAEFVEPNPGSDPPSRGVTHVQNRHSGSRRLPR